MNPGKLNKRLTIQRSVEKEDENSITKSEWQDLKKVWGSMNNLSGKEYWNAKQYNAENTVEFEIRYNSCPDISEKDRIIYKDLVFNIISPPDNVKYRNEIIKIKAMEVR